MTKQTKQISRAYQLARERYAALGVNTDTVLKHQAKVPVSRTCLARLSTAVG